MNNKSTAFIGSESKEIKNKIQRVPLIRRMYEMRNTKLASFDIFDTLLLRPFSDPKDLFYILGGKFNEIDFYNLRIRCEREARDIKERKFGNREINIYDIYRRINYYTGIDVEFGVKTEFETELDLIYVNEYQKNIFYTFINNKIPIIIVSDMYYPEDMMEQLLEKNGIRGYEKLYVSCDRECAKGDGGLFDVVVSEYHEIPRASITHIDDNWNVILKAREKGFTAVHYPKNVALTNKFRPQFMSAVIGSAYKGIVGNFLAHDENKYDVPYEYGFTYGGFLVLGYCSYIHELCKRENIEKVLFMSRDGDIVKQVWDYMYNDIPSEYILISRMAVMRLSAEIWKKMLIECVVDRMSTRKCGMTIGEILEEYELTMLKDQLQDYDLTTDMVISAKEDELAVSRFRDFIEGQLQRIQAIYKESNLLYEKYIGDIISSIKGKVALIDIGWRGVNGTAISKVIKRVRPNIETINILLGGRQPVNLPQIRKREIRCYLFSAEKNYDALGKHADKTNFYFELLTMSASSSFKYFYRDKDKRIRMKLTPGTPQNYSVILEIQRGILDFVKEYTKRFCKYPSFYEIPADDVAQVVYNIMSRDEYFKKYFSNLSYSPEIGKEESASLGEWI